MVVTGVCSFYPQKRTTEKKGSCVFKGHSHFGEHTNRGFGIRATLVLMEGFVSWVFGVLNSYHLAGVG